MSSPWYLPLATLPANPPEDSWQDISEKLVTQILDPTSSLAQTIRAQHEEGNTFVVLANWRSIKGYEYRINEVLQRRIPELPFRVVCHPAGSRYNRPQYEARLHWIAYLPHPK